MALDTPATIAILGAGPIGLEAALYARYLGYDVHLYERGEVAANVRRWGHVQMFTPFGENCSSLGVAALRTQDANWQPPKADDLLTGREFAERYLCPLAKSDLVVDSLHEHADVVGVARDGPRKEDLAVDESRGDWMFRLLVRHADGREESALADIVIDSTGVLGNPRWIGQGGIPAPGELELSPEIDYWLPDVLGAERDRFADRHTLLVGIGHWAAQLALTFARLAAQAPQTRVTWISGFTLDDPGDKPSVSLLPAGDDRSAYQRTVDEANRLISSGQAWLKFLPTSMVGAVERTSDGNFLVTLIGQEAGQFEFDRIVANVGYKPDYRLLEELHIARDVASDAPQPVQPGGLILHEPNFYILGAKSFGRRDDFLLSTGLRQIRDLFKVIGDRESLDLYATLANFV